MNLLFLFCCSGDVIVIGIVSERMRIMTDWVLLRQAGCAAVITVAHNAVSNVGKGKRVFHILSRVSDTKHFA